MRRAAFSSYRKPYPARAFRTVLVMLPNDNMNGDYSIMFYSWVNIALIGSSLVNSFSSAVRRFARIWRSCNHRKTLTEECAP